MILLLHASLRHILFIVLIKTFLIDKANKSLSFRDEL